MYTLDTNLAAEADSDAYITESGAYVGVFTLAHEIKSSQKGTKGVELHFRSTDGAEAKRIEIWTLSTEGRSLFGYKTIMAIMTCMNVKALQPTPGTADLYDWEQKAEVPTAVTLLPQLMGPLIGVVLQKEEYYNSNGQLKFKMTHVGSFDPKTKRTASEMIKNAKPERLAHILRRLKDKKAAPQHQQPQQYESQQYQDGPPASVYDDIPF